MKKLSWGLLALVVIGALAYGVTDRKAPTNEQRAHNVGETIACPACSGESVTDSQAPIAVSIRQQIAEMIDKGKSDDDIRETIAASYGRQVILNPPKSGVAGLVWVLPVAGLVAALAGLVVAFRRWRTPAEVQATADDLEAAQRAREAEELP
jgi:cytochrome c-type biogenesis protein CcmH